MKLMILKLRWYVPFVSSDIQQKESNNHTAKLSALSKITRIEEKKSSSTLINGFPEQRKLVLVIIAFPFTFKCDT